MRQAEQIHTSGAASVGAVTASGLPLPADLTDFQRDYLIKLDARALVAGEQIRAAHPAPAELRIRAAEYRARGLEWLAGINNQLADDLERDPRLAALGPLTAASHGDGGFGRMFIPLYRDILLAHVERREVVDYIDNCSHCGAAPEDAGARCTTGEGRPGHPCDGEAP